VTWDLTAEKLTKTYGSRTVVRDVTLGLNAGEVVGLLGPNGAGKTTTFYMMVGLVKPDRGRVSLRGVELAQAPLHVRAREGIGYLPQEASTFRRLSVEENLLLIWEARGYDPASFEERLVRSLEDFGLTALRHQSVMALSGGERRRLEIARALATNPSYLLLDEPFTGVDPLHVSEIQDIVRRLVERGIGILITDHNATALLELVHRVYVIREGEILVQGTPAEVVANDLARQHYLGENFAYASKRALVGARAAGASPEPPAAGPSASPGGAP
jgi:lipopolysaccharide export system ATP-binding protein